MSGIPSNISRVPNLLASRLFLSNITRTNLGLLTAQEQLATGRSVLRPSDDPVRAATILTIQDDLERTDQRLRNLSHADGVVGMLDQTVGEVTDLLREAKGIALSQIGIGSDADTRRTQAVVIDSMLREVFSLGNRDVAGVYLFGGSTPGSPPIEQTLGGFRYRAQGDGLTTDLGTPVEIPITVGGESAIGQVAARVQGTRDLDPVLTLQTRLSDLDGARRLGFAPGTVNLTIDGQDAGTIDLTGAGSVGDVVRAIEGAIREQERVQDRVILGPGGVGVSGGAITIDAEAGPPPVSIEIADEGSGAAAADLGLAGVVFAPGQSAGADVHPRLTLRTPLESLAGLTLPLGSVRFRLDNGQGEVVREVDLSGARTIDDIRALVEAAGMGVRLEINASGTGIDLRSEISGMDLSIEEVEGGDDTATLLGIRSMSAETPAGVLNHGRGVRVVHGSVDPQTGLPDPARDVDFVVTLGDGSSFEVDLRPADLTTVGGIVARINAEAQRAVDEGRIPAGSVEAGLTDGRNGIALRDAGGLGRITVTATNNSLAASDLGLLRGEWDIASGVLIAEDRAKVRVDSVFSALVALRDALRGDDEIGISLAGADLDRQLDRVTQTRALSGVYAGRVAQATTRAEGQKVLDESLRSQLQDLDYAEASVRLGLLQTQAQAGYASAVRAQSLSLLNFLG